MKKQNKTLRFLMRLTKKDLQNITLLARRQNVSKSEAVRKLIAAAEKMKPEQLKKLLNE